MKKEKKEEEEEEEKKKKKKNSAKTYRTSDFIGCPNKMEDFPTFESYRIVFQERK